MRHRRIQRREPLRIAGRRVLIACEGSKTEPAYFEGIRISLHLPAVRLIVVHPDGTDPRTVVEAAVERRDAERLDRRWTADDSAWAVFDGDEHIANDPTNWHEALDIARRKGIHLAVSNPSFEYWYLLHYRDHFAHLTRDRARQLLKTHIPDYEKSSRLYPTPLQPLTSDAIQRAKTRAGTILRDELDHYTNPVTTVHVLVELLLNLAPGR